MRKEILIHSTIKLQTMRYWSAMAQIKEGRPAGIPFKHSCEPVLHIQQSYQSYPHNLHRAKLSTTRRHNLWRPTIPTLVFRTKSSRRSEHILALHGANCSPRILSRIQLTPRYHLPMRMTSKRVKKTAQLPEYHTRQNAKPTSPISTNPSSSSHRLRNDQGGSRCCDRSVI